MDEKWYQVRIKDDRNEYLIKLKAFQAENARKLARLAISDILGVHEALLEASDAEESDSNVAKYDDLTTIYQLIEW